MQAKTKEKKKTDTPTKTSAASASDGSKKRPAAATAAVADETGAEIKVSNPQFYKNLNSWGLKMGKKQVISVAWLAFLGIWFLGKC